MNLVTPITAEAFDASAPLRRVLAHEHPRRFGALELPGGTERVVLSWRSDLIEPVVVEDGAGGLWVGVDQRVVALAADGVRFSAGLSSPLLDIKRFPAFVVILCDADLLMVNEDYSVRRIETLADVPSSVELVGDRLSVTFLDGSVTGVST